MSPELEQAIKERIALGHTKDQITSEMQSAGYDQATTDAVYEQIVSQSTGTQTATSLPRNRDLIRSSWQYMLDNINLVLLLAVPTAVLGALDYLANYSSVELGGVSLTALIIGTFALVVLMVLLQVAVLRLVMTSLRGEQVSFEDAFVWARNNFLSWFWVAILSGLVIMGGWMLFIIPGIIASVYLLFAQYVFADEGKTGMAALQRSRELVYGRFSTVAWRLLGIFVFVVLFYIPVGILLGIAEVSPSESVLLLVTTVLEAAASGVVGVFAAYYFGRLYVSLYTPSTGSVQPTGWYKAYALLGILVFGALVALAAVGIAVMDDVDMQSLSQPAALEQELDPEVEAFMQEFEAEFEAF